jgi:hypothetical protein
MWRGSLCVADTVARAFSGRLRPAPSAVYPGQAGKRDGSLRCDVTALAQQQTADDEKGWRATFYTTGMEHSPTSATGTGWERTPWHATQRAAWEAR